MRGRRSWLIALGLVALAGAVARALPLIGGDSALATSVFDEGVYASSSGLFASGDVPYRDFVLLHPPGILLLTWPLAALAPEPLSWADFLVACRWLAVLVGAANILLVGALGTRWRGPLAGVVAAGIYAAYPPAVIVERHLVLEPFVNLFVLLAAWVWLGRPAGARASTGRAAGAGALIGVATLVKLTGGLVFVALLASERLREAWRERVTAAVAAGAVFALAIIPFVAAAGLGRVFELVVTAQIDRPGGDTGAQSVGSVLGRIAHFMGLGSVVGSGAAPKLLGLIGLAVVLAALAFAWRRGGRDGRFWAALFGIVLVALLLAPDFYPQYPAPLAAPLALGVAWALAELLELERVPRLVAPAVALAVAGALAVALARGWGDREPSGRAFAAHVDEARTAIPAGDCLVADPPALALSAERLPGGGGAPLADPFGALLVPALAADTAPTTPAALTSAPAQATARTALSACRYVALGVKPENNDHFSDATRDWFTRHFRPLDDPAESPTLWVRRTE